MCFRYKNTFYKTQSGVLMCVGSKVGYHCNCHMPILAATKNLLLCFHVTRLGETLLKSYLLNE